MRLLPVLPSERLERVSGWGEAVSGAAYVYRPSTPEGIRQVFETARMTGRFVGLRGAGRSYGDAAMASENLCLDLTRMNRILEWNPETGIITVEAGVTIRQMWQFILGDGWWPPVVSGTMFPTTGGVAAMNIHGKNHFALGSWGEHVLKFDLLLPSGERVCCSPTLNADLFHSVLGGFGMLGVITALTMKMKRVHSGYLKVEPLPVAGWEEMFSEFARRADRSDYLVGWVDAFAAGPQAGRGQIHQANYLAPGEDPAPTQSLRVENQELPETLFGLVPKSILWRFIQPFLNDTGVRAINTAKYFTSVRNRKTHPQSHAGFHFLLDYIPDWKRAYGRGGLIQYQSFVPKETALDCYREQIALCQRRGIVPYLAVFKQHRPTPFLMNYTPDGFSLALDFRVTPARRKALWELTADLDRIVLDAGGNFYFAKDATLHPSRLAGFRSEERYRRFVEIKQRTDPENLLQTDLFRRLFAPGAG
ncbi:MAG: FAD-binding oxidoreductase [Bacteroidia bacterium]|nr:FAD-binding oxidoreductase [Bacteroidia bacterium]